MYSVHLKYTPDVSMNTDDHRLLLGGFNQSEKYEFVNWDDDIPKKYMGK